MQEDNIPEVGTTPPVTSPTPPVPPEADDFMKGLEAAAKQDLSEAAPKKAEAKPSEFDLAFADKPKTQEVMPEASTEVKLTVEPEQAVVPDTELTEDVKVPSRRADWDRFREKYNKTFREKEDLRKLSEEFKTKAADVAEVERLRQEHAELTAKFKEATVVNDPTLTADIDQKIGAIIKLAKSAVPDAAKAENLETILRMPVGQYRDRAMEEFFSDVPSHKQAIIAAHIANADQALMERDGRIQNAKANADAILKQRQQQAEMQRQARVQRVEKVFADVTNEFKSRDGWKDIMANAELARAIESGAKTTYSGGVHDEAELARKAYHAEAAPVVMRLALEQAKKLQELEGTIAKLKGAGPTVNTLGTTNTSRRDDGDFLSTSALAQHMR